MNREKLHKNENRNSFEQERLVKLDRLVESGEWTRLNESNEFREMSVEGRIVKTGKAIRNRVNQLTGFFGHSLAKRPDQSAVILDKMRYLRHAEDVLDEVLVNHINGEKVVAHETNIINLVERKAKHDLKKAA